MLFIRINRSDLATLHFHNSPFVTRYSLAVHQAQRSGSHNTGRFGAEAAVAEAHGSKAVGNGQFHLSRREIALGANEHYARFTGVNPTVELRLCFTLAVGQRTLAHQILCHKLFENRQRI